MQKHDDGGEGEQGLVHGQHQVAHPEPIHADDPSGRPHSLVPAEALEAGKGRVHPGTAGVGLALVALALEGEGD